MTRQFYGMAAFTSALAIVLLVARAMDSSEQWYWRILCLVGSYDYGIHFTEAFGAWRDARP